MQRNGHHVEQSYVHHALKLGCQNSKWLDLWDAYIS